MTCLGAHLSAAGGVSRAAAAAVALECEALQVFLRPPGRWQSPAPKPGEIARFRALTLTQGFVLASFAHAPYLLNLASAADELRRRSVAVLAEELRYADALGMAGVVVHPGSAAGGDRSSALMRCRKALAEAVALAGAGSAAVVLEVTAGGGGHLGSSVQELASLRPRLDSPSPRPFGVCLDLAHLWAAGYDLHADGWERAMAELEKAWGEPRPYLLHANDTPVACGSRRDRHAPPGEGVLGEKVFRRLLADQRLAGVPVVVEIPPGRDNQLVAATLARLRAWRAEAWPPQREIFEVQR